MTPPNDHPFLPPAIEDIRKPIRFSLTWIELLVVALIILILTAVLLPAVRAAREITQGRYNDNLKMLALGLQNYGHSFKRYPPAYTQGPQGQNLHSWRSLILPFVEENRAFQAIDFSAPWDSPENSSARRSLEDSKGFQCPDSRYAQPGNCVYHASVGEDAFFHPHRGRELNEIGDPSSLTLMIVESHHRHSIPIMKPEDLTKKQLCTAGYPWAPRHFSDKFYVAMVDGSLREISIAMDPMVFQNLINITSMEKAPL